MKKDIILIGPIGVGKSTVGELLAKHLNLPQISMDDIRFEYYKEIGYDEEYAKKLKSEKGFWGIYPYWKPFEAYSVERILSDYQDCIIDLGAGHSVYEDEALFLRVKNAFADYENIILLMPSFDREESITIINERENWLLDITPNINMHFINHHSNYDLAKFTVYTKDKTPEETCSEILDLISS